MSKPASTPLEINLNFDQPALSTRVQFSNTTTRTKVEDNSLIQIVEILSKGFILELPARSCANGHNILLDVKVESITQEPINLSITARVEEVTNLRPDRDRVAVKFVQYNELDWERYLNVFDNRQQEIEQFLKAARGY